MAMTRSLLRQLAKLLDAESTAPVHTSEHLNWGTEWMRVRYTLALIPPLVNLAATLCEPTSMVPGTLDPMVIRITNRRTGEWPCTMATHASKQSPAFPAVEKCH